VPVSVSFCLSTNFFFVLFAYVSGGNRGIGFETALALAEKGAQVIIGLVSHDRLYLHV
jgi:NADP-dependent 3-hydroxy acid dehydrogenase YdfG